MFLIFDIGGSKTRLSASFEGESFVEPKVFSTPLNFEEGVGLIGQSAKEFAGGEKLDAVVGGIRRLNLEKSALLEDFRLSDWSGKPLKERLEEVLSCPVYLENDTALVGLGEAVKGAGTGFEIVSYLTVSTGVGGVRIVDGKIDRNKFGFELGRQVIDIDWSKFPDAKELERAGFGQLEAYISGASIEKRTGKKAAEITDQGFWDEIAEILAVALVNTALYWSPDVIVLGGGMFGNPGISLDKVRLAYNQGLKIFPSLPELKLAELGEFGGLHGALAYLKNLNSNI